MYFKHSGCTIGSLLWKLLHVSSKPTHKRLSVTAQSLNGRTRRAAADKRQRTTEHRAQSRQHQTHWITNRRGAAARKQQGHGIVSGVAHDQRAGIAARTKRAAVNHDLIRVRDSELLT